MTDPTTDPKATTLSGMVRSKVSKTAAQLEAVGIPAHTAEAKAKSTAGGWAIAFFGLAMLATAGYVALLIVQGTREISVMVVVLVGLIGSFGLGVFGLGMNMVSRDASPMMDKLGEWAVKFVKAIRGGGGTNA